MAKKKTIWEALEAKTGKQVSLWLITIVSMVIFSNNVLTWWGNLVQSPGLVGVFNLLTFFILRIILGKLFD